MLMAILFYSNNTVQNGVQYYKANRPHSYGSYLGAYREKYELIQCAPISPDEMKHRMDVGIASGWKTDASAIYGAVRWYHREEAGQILIGRTYRPIIQAYLE